MQDADRPDPARSAITGSELWRTYLRRVSLGEGSTEFFDTPGYQGAAAWRGARPQHFAATTK